MEYIRVIHRRHYDRRRKKFQSLAFKNSSNGGGISVIGKECILQRSSTICGHISEYYARIASEPPIFWEVDEQILPSTCNIVQQESNTGDLCHHNIYGVSDKEARNIIKNVPVQDFKICKGLRYRNLILADVEDSL